MAEELKTYYDFADNNFDFLMAAYKNGLVGNAMGAMTQETCEKYLKHLIDEYVVPENSTDNVQKTEVLRTHNLTKLSKYISVHLPEVKLDRQSLNLVNGLYFTTRYPGDESILVEKEDLDDYMDAVRKCKKAVDDFIQSRNE
ncbi:HEPN domain-containing protein [uncultured Merdimonas sp.]|uniref:HEPN domain-containing protein n=1 Tax=uncultured Merdimonas sp. TaxID=2023269 RepID=UPI003209AF19